MATMTAIKLDGNLYRDEIFADLAPGKRNHARVGNRAGG